MNGEIISLETAEKIAKLEKENKRLKRGLKKAINKVCEQDVIIAEALEILSKINYGDKNEYIPPLEILPVYKILKGDKNEIR